MKLATSSQMQALDKEAIERCGVPSLDLMERAGRAVADAVIERFPKKGRALVFAGKGNNGGDGFVAARYLAKAGFKVKVFVFTSWKEFSPDARTNWEKLADLKIEADEVLDDAEAKKLQAEAKRADVVIDAIFGTGLAQEIKGRYKFAIEAINSSLKPVISADIPSGLSADTGLPLGVAVRAKLTVTFGLLKLGLVTGHAHEYSKENVVADIGFPPELINKTETGYYLIEQEMFAGHFGKRPSESHKGDFGHVLVVAGSAGKIGAGLLASRGALRSGAGLVTYALPSTAYAKFDTKSPEVMYEPLSDNNKGFLTKAGLPAVKKLIAGKSVLAIGPGLGTEDETSTIVSELVKKSAIPVVVDADGLNCLAKDLHGIGAGKAPIVFTPHIGEMARLAGLGNKQILDDRMGVARKFAKAQSVYLVLKGAKTIIATPDGNIYINPTGNPGMATAGMGDVLTGVIAGFIAQKLPILTAVIAGVYIHGLAGDMAAKDIGERGLLASDVINMLPKAISKLRFI